MAAPPNDEAREKLIEVMARAIHGTAAEGIESSSWVDLDADAQAMFSEWAAAALDAALGAVDEETCPECGGSGKVRKPSELGPGMHVNTFSSIGCPSCAGSGKVNPRWLSPKERNPSDS